VKKVTTKWPKWAVKVSDLNKWSKIQGVFLMSGGTAQVLFVDSNQPVGIALMRPLKLDRTGKAIIGAFVLDDGKDRYFVCCRYSPHLKAFVLKMQLEHWNFMTWNPQLVKYVDSQDREQLQAGLDFHWENESWPLEKTGSSLQPSLLERIFSSKKARARNPAYSLPA
jgi:hypothetical protein